MVQALYIDSSNTLIQDLAARKSGDNFFTLKKGEKISDFRPVVQKIFDRLQEIDTTKASLEDLQKAAHTIRTIHTGAKKQLCFWRNTGEWLLEHIPFFNHYATKSYCDRSYKLLQKAAYCNSKKGELEKAAQTTDQAAKTFFEGAKKQYPKTESAKKILDETLSEKPSKDFLLPKSNCLPFCKAWAQVLEMPSHQDLSVYQTLYKKMEVIEAIGLQFQTKTLRQAWKLAHYSNRCRNLAEKKAASHDLTEIRKAAETTDKVAKKFFEKAKTRHIKEIVTPQVGHFLSVVLYMFKQHPEFKPMMLMLKSKDPLCWRPSLPSLETEKQIRERSAFSTLFEHVQKKRPNPSEELLKVEEYRTLFLPEWEKLQTTLSHLTREELWLVRKTLIKNKKQFTPGLSQFFSNTKQHQKLFKYVEQASKDRDWFTSVEEK